MALPLVQPCEAAAAAGSPCPVSCLSQELLSLAASACCAPDSAGSSPRWASAALLVQEAGTGLSALCAELCPSRGRSGGQQTPPATALTCLGGAEQAPTAQAWACQACLCAHLRPCKHQARPMSLPAIAPGVQAGRGSAVELGPLGSHLPHERCQPHTQHARWYGSILVKAAQGHQEQAVRTRVC